MSRIFINYRREDTAPNASRIYEWLSERYGDDQVFMDVDTIEPGLDWMVAIDRAVGSADLVLALIGTDWLNEFERRGFGSDDPMRHELETALARKDIRVIPLLVNGAKMPPSSELPPTLSSLARRHALEIMRPGDERFRVDKQALLERVDRVIGVPPTTESTVAPGEEQQRIVQPPPPPPQGETRPQLSEEARIEVELAKWNWGAFLLTWVWGVANGVYRSFLVWIPFYGLYEWVMLGKNGNRLAWETKRWQTIDEFHTTQRKWAIWAWVVAVVVILIIIGSTSSSGSSS
jgi:TIR domain